MTIYQPLIFAFSFKQLYIVEIIASPGAKQKFCKDHWRNDLLSSSLLRANGTIVLHRIVNNLFGFSYYNFRVIISLKSRVPIYALSLYYHSHRIKSGMATIMAQKFLNPQMGINALKFPLTYYGTVVESRSKSLILQTLLKQRVTFIFKIF